MKTKLLLIFSAVFIAVMVSLYINREAFLTAGLAKAANFSAAEYFQGSIRLKGVSMDRSLRISIQRFEGILKTDGGPVPLEISRIQSRESVLRLFAKEGAAFDFLNLRPQNSVRKGVAGTFHYYAGREWFSRVQLQVEALGLEDIQWLNPKDLLGAQGEMTGTMTFTSNFKKEIGFFADLKIAEPGGLLQEKFFETLKPYLPSMKEIKDKIRQDGRSMIRFRSARLFIRLLDAETLVGLFRIQIPEYNLNLNLNLTVKMDEKNAFSQLFDIMGLVRF